MVYVAFRLLFAFNVGIEIGQLLFVGLVLAAWWLLQSLPIRWPAGSIYVPAYAIGSLAVYWMLERSAAVL